MNSDFLLLQGRIVPGPLTRPTDLLVLPLQPLPYLVLHALHILYQNLSRPYHPRGMLLRVRPGSVASVPVLSFPEWYRVPGVLR